MRRDGFASVSIGPYLQPGVLVTRPAQFSGDKTAMFVNVGGADARRLAVSVLDAATEQPLPGLASGKIDQQGVRVQVAFEGGASALAKAGGTPVRVKFYLPAGANDAQLFSFWLADDSCGASNGWVAAGGPGFNASRDLCGSCRCQ